MDPERDAIGRRKPSVIRSHGSALSAGSRSLTMAGSRFCRAHGAPDPGIHLPPHANGNIDAGRYDPYADSAPLSFPPLHFSHGVLLSRDIGCQANATHATSMTRIYDVPTDALVLLLVARARRRRQGRSGAKA
jgi:hypothetical protein